MLRRPTTAPRVTHEAKDDLQFERVVFFSDAVFAIAITLLVIDLKLPDNIEGDVIQAMQTTPVISGRILGFIIGFLVIGVYWIAHHRHFKYITRYNHTLIWLNLFFLMGIVFMPFVTAVIGEHGNQAGVVALYAASVSITGLLLVLLWLYATDRKQLVDPGLDEKFIRYFTLRAALPSIIFMLSIPVAYLPFEGAPYWAMGIWALTLATRSVLTRIYGYTE